jgi:hypothetical protein
MAHVCTGMVMPNRRWINCAAAVRVQSANGNFS